MGEKENDNYTCQQHNFETTNDQFGISYLYWELTPPTNVKPKPLSS